MKALSIRAPWWWFVIHAGKDIENRDWKPSNPGLRFRGPVLIHASKWWKLDEAREDMEDGIEMFRASGQPPTGHEIMPRQLRDLGGHIVGRAEVVDMVCHSDSPWFMGPIGLVLCNAEPVEPWPCKGSLGFFNPVMMEKQAN